MNERQQEIINVRELIINFFKINEIDVCTSWEAMLGIVTEEAVKMEGSNDKFMALLFEVYKDFKQLKELEGEE